MGRRGLLAMPLGIAALLASGVGGDDRGRDRADAEPSHTVAGSIAPRPPIVRRPIPFGPRRKREMVAYSSRHYGERTWRLRRPRVIVEHVAVAGSAGAVYNAFAPDVPDPELGELPNVCAHFVVATSGRILQLVNLRTRCRHTVGLNWTAIGIEHTGYGDGDVLGTRRQMRASLRLTRYLRCRFGIETRDVIGHRESLRSRFHRERLPRLRTQTHGDWRLSSMRIYRERLSRLGGCEPARHAVGRAIGVGRRDRRASGGSDGAW